MAKGLDKGATQLRIEGQCRDTVAKPAGCTLCGSNDHSTTRCPMRAQAAPVGEPDCDRSACGDFSPGPCDNPDCPALRSNKAAPVGEMRAGQEPVAVVRTVPGTDWKFLDFAPGFSLQEQDELTKLYTTPQPSAVPDARAFKDELLKATKWFMHPHIEGVFAVFMQQQATAPATVQGVNQQLLEALEGLLECAVHGFDMPSDHDFADKARAAIAAARQEGKA